MNHVMCNDTKREAMNSAVLAVNVFVLYAKRKRKNAKKKVDRLSRSSFEIREEKRISKWQGSLGALVGELIEQRIYACIMRPAEG